MLATNAPDGTADDKCGGPTSMIDRRMMRHFLDTLDNKSGSAFQFSMIKQKPDQPDTGRTIDRYGTLKDCYRWIEENSRDGYSAYVVVNQTDGSGKRKAANIVAARAVWNDCDHGIADNYPIEPTLRVHTSTGKVQDYWLLDGHMDLSAHDSTIDAIVANHKGDKGCKGRPRILRLPGSLNWKYGEPQLVTLEQRSGVDYTAEQIVEAFPPLANDKPVKGTALTAKDLPASLSKPASSKRYDLEVVADALTSLSADDRNVWVEYGIAIKRDWGEEGKTVWLDWSATSKLYDEADALEKWGTFDTSPRHGAITCGTIIAAAKAVGWRAPGSAVTVESNHGTQVEIVWPEMRGNTPDPNSSANILHFLDATGVEPWHNDFDHCDYLREPSGTHTKDTKLNDKTALDLRMKMHAVGLRVGKDLCNDVVMWEASRRTAHPVREYLDGLEWDKTPRLDRWLHTYCGAADNEYHRLVGSKWKVAAVRRVRQPGCKFDNMLVFEGAQNAGKSSVFRTLASPDWFSDGVAVGAGSKETIEITGGKWIVESAELAGMSKRDVNEVKQALSKQTDKARLSYDRFSIELPRQFVFCGTTNSAKYLSDISGGRRFWCVETGKIDLAKLAEDRDKLWAEAAHREAAGKPIHLKDDEYALAVAEQSQREVDDPIEIQVEEMIGDLKEGTIWKTDMFAALGYDNASKGGGTIGAKLAPIMSKLGWHDGRVSDGGRQRRCFSKGNGPVLLPFEGRNGRCAGFKPERRV